MYTPKYYRNENIEEVKDFIVHNGFGILVSVQSTDPTASCGRPESNPTASGGAPIIATHIPMLLDKNEKGEDILSGHVSRANPHHKEFTEGNQVLAIFLGPHAYVSSSWYSHENVPTWNYIAVHVYGKIKIIEGARLLRQLKMLVDKYEGGPPRVYLEKMNSGYVQKQMHGIVGFEIQIEEIQAAYKLSQNRNEQDYDSVIRELENRGDAHSIAVAAEMRKRLRKK